MRQNWDKYQSNKREMGSAKAMGTIDEDYQRRVQTMHKAWERFTAQVTDVAITIGSTLLPTLVETLDVLAPAVRAFGQWADAHPGVLRGVIGLAAGVATKYLVNYLGWRRMLERYQQSILPVHCLQEALGWASQHVIGT